MKYSIIVFKEKFKAIYYILMAFTISGCFQNNQIELGCRNLIPHVTSDELPPPLWKTTFLQRNVKPYPGQCLLIDDFYLGIPIETYEAIRAEYYKPGTITHPYNTYLSQSEIELVCQIIRTGKIQQRTYTNALPNEGDGASGEWKFYAVDKASKKETRLEIAYSSFNWLTSKSDEKTYWCLLYETSLTRILIPQQYHRPLSAMLNNIYKRAEKLENE